MESSARLAPSHYAFITWAHILHINVQSLYLVNEGTEIHLVENWYFHHLQFVLASNQYKEIYVSTIIPTNTNSSQSSFEASGLTYPGRLMARKRSQIASFNLLHYLFLLSKSVLVFMTSVHQSNLKRVGNKYSSEEGESETQVTPPTSNRERK